MRTRRTEILCLIAWHLALCLILTAISPRAFALAPRSQYNTVASGEADSRFDSEGPLIAGDPTVIGYPDFWLSKPIAREGSMYLRDSDRLINRKDSDQSPIIDFVNRFMSSCNQINAAVDGDALFVLQNLLTNSLANGNKFQVGKGLLFQWRLSGNALEVMIQDEGETVRIPGYDPFPASDATRLQDTKEYERLESLHTRSVCGADGKVLGTRTFAKILFAPFTWEPIFKKEGALESYLKSPGWLSLPLNIKRERLAKVPARARHGAVEKEIEAVKTIEAVLHSLRTLPQAEAQQTLLVVSTIVHRPELIPAMDYLYRNSAVLEQRIDLLDYFASLDPAFAADPLIKLFKMETNQEARAAVLRMLGGLRIPDAMGMALPLLESDKDYVVYDALVAVTHIGGAKAAEAARRMTGHKNAQIAKLAQDALIYLGLEKESASALPSGLREYLMRQDGWKVLSSPQGLSAEKISFEDGVYLSDQRKWINIFDSLQRMDLWRVKTEYSRLIEILKGEVAKLQGINPQTAAFVFYCAMKNAFVHGNGLEKGKGVGANMVMKKDEIILHVYDEGKDDLLKAPLHDAPFLMARGFAGHGMSFQRMGEMGVKISLSPLRNEKGERIGTISSFVIPRNSEMQGDSLGMMPQITNTDEVIAICAYPLYSEDPKG